MNVLLDTGALLALAGGDLPRGAATALRRAPEALGVGRQCLGGGDQGGGGELRLKEPPARWFLAVVERYELLEVPLDAGIACAAAAMPLLHRDPFDRVIVALAQAHGLTVLTSDENIRQYAGVKTLW